MICRLCHRDIIFIDQQDNRLIIMSTHGTCQYQKAVPDLYRSSLIMQDMANQLFIIICRCRTVQEIPVFHTDICNRCTKHPIGSREIKTIHTFEGNKKCRIPVHPLITEGRVPRNFQSIKKSHIVFPDIKKSRQHAHTKGFPKSAGTGDQGDLCSGSI